MGAASGLSGYISVSSADRCLNQRFSAVLASITVLPIVLLDLTVPNERPTRNALPRKRRMDLPSHDRSVDASRPDQTLHPRSSPAHRGRTRLHARCRGRLFWRASLKCWAMICSSGPATSECRRRSAEWLFRSVETAIHLSRPLRGGGRRVERARIILPQRETHEHADGGRHRYRDQQTHETEKVPEGEQREHHPHRIQVDPAADQVR